MTQLHFTSPVPQFAQGKVRGACPTLREPMATGDGLLARLRPVGGGISPAQLEAIAVLAGQYGNGQVEITARGNLQVRGLQAGTVPAFAAAVEALMPIETGVPIETSPLAGLDTAEIADGRPIAAAIRQAMGALPAALGPKVTVVIDGAGAIDMGGLASDVGLRAVEPSLWLVTVGGTAIGCVSTNGATAAVVRLLRLIAALGPGGRGRDLDPDAARRELAEVIVDRVTLPTARPASASSLALRDGRIAVAIALPFGAANAASLIGLAQVAKTLDIGEFRLAPQHGLIALCPSDHAVDQVRLAASGLGFLDDPADPRRSIKACIGSEGCASGWLPARRIGETLARLEPEFFDGSFALHVSGCAKGCAHPGATLLALVGAEAGMALVFDDRAKAAPALNLPPETTESALQRLAALWRDNRGLGESVASCFKRLGAARIAAAARQG